MTLKLIDPGPSRRGAHHTKSVLECPRRYALKRDADARGEKWRGLEDPLVKGSLLHVALAHHYARIKEEAEGKEESQYLSPHGAVEALIQRQPEDDRPFWRAHAPLILDTVDAYELHWWQEDWEVMDIERELTATVLDEQSQKAYFYTQRADLVVKDTKSGKWWIVDHKTTGRVTKETIKVYSMSGQFLGYEMLGQSLLGDDWGGVIINLIEWPKKGSPKFLRRTLPMQPVALKNYKRSIIHAERVIGMYDSFPPNEWPGSHHETACKSWGRLCPFFQRCGWGMTSETV